jgi:hypothetical protein
MKKIALTIIFIFILVFTVVPSVHADNNGIILRTDVSPLYIANQTICMELQGLYYINDIPQNAVLTFTVIIMHNGNLSEIQNFTAQNGMIIPVYLNGLPVGAYNFEVYAICGNVRSPNNDGQFLITYAPIPYTAYFLSGGELVFHSDDYSYKGVYNKNYTFTVSIRYLTNTGSSYVVQLFTGITNCTFYPQNEGQIVSASVEDCYGWLNSASMNIAQMDFAGVPITYDFGFSQRQPFESVEWENVLLAVLIIAFLFMVLIWYYRGRLK